MLSSDFSWIVAHPVWPESVLHDDVDMVSVKPKLTSTVWADRVAVEGEPVHPQGETWSYIPGVRSADALSPDPSLRRYIVRTGVRESRRPAHGGR